MQTKACSQPWMLTLIIIKRGKRTHLSLHSPLLHLLAHPTSGCHSSPLLLMDPDSKRVWAVQLPLGWTVQYSLWCLIDWIRKASQGQGRPSVLHCTTPTQSLQDSISFFMPLLFQCILMVFLSVECLPVHLQWYAVPCTGTGNALYIPLYKPKWSEEPIIPGTALPCVWLLLSTPNYWHKGTSRFQDDSSNPVSKDAWSSLAQEAPHFI